MIKKVLIVLGILGLAACEQTDLQTPQSQNHHDKISAKDFKATFFESGVQTCVETAKKSASEERATQYCQCAMEKAAAALSNDDIQTIETQRNLTPEINAKLMKVIENADECRADLGS